VEWGRKALEKRESPGKGSKESQKREQLDRRQLGDRHKGGWGSKRITVSVSDHLRSGEHQQGKKGGESKTEV